MKNPSYKLSIIICLLFSFTSCVKDVTKPNSVAPIADPQNLSELRASDNFNWSTSKKVTIDINGISTEGSQLALQILDADGNLIMRKLQKANENYKTEIEIPVHQEYVNIVYGDASQLYDCTSGIVSVTLQ